MLDVHRQTNARVTNARGVTVMPGSIDSYQHPIPGDMTEWLEKDDAALMRALLETGFRTLLSAITPEEGLERRRRTESGVVRGCAPKSEYGTRCGCVEAIFAMESSQDRRHGHALALRIAMPLKGALIRVLPNAMGNVGQKPMRRIGRSSGCAGGFVFLSLCYVVLGWILQLAALRVRSNASKDLEIVVLRHELGILQRRSVGRR
jgi:hypothetical protein